MSHDQTANWAVNILFVVLALLALGWVWGVVTNWGRDRVAPGAPRLHHL
ncbi:MAG: hypothetical protein HND48_21520 [Chloroflexi bacterium]|nr:hypothetical protein [Chloroflexota bacterium]